MSSLPWGLALIGFLVPLGIWGLWRFILTSGEADGEMEHARPNESPEMSQETQSRLLGIGMAEQHERRS